MGAFSLSMSNADHITIAEIVTPQEWEAILPLIEEDPWYHPNKSTDNRVSDILELLCRAQKVEKEDGVSISEVKPAHAQWFFELFNRTRTLFGKAFEKEPEWLLLVAIQNKWVNGVRFLLQQGYNPNDERILDELLESYERHWNDDLIFQALLEAGLDGNIRHRKGDLYSEFIAESCWSWFEKMAEFQNLDLSKHEGIILALLTRPSLVWIAKEGEPV